MTPTEISKIYTDTIILLEEEGYESSFTSDYSGRSIYGSTVPGIVTDASPAILATFVATAVFMSIDEKERSNIHPMDFMELVLGATPKRTDSMGRSTIYY